MASGRALLSPRMTRQTDVLTAAFHDHVQLKDSLSIRSDPPTED
jgi:hypothetical protein